MEAAGIEPESVPSDILRRDIPARWRRSSPRTLRMRRWRREIPLRLRSLEWRTDDGDFLPLPIDADNPGSCNPPDPNSRRRLKRRTRSRRRRATRNPFDPQIAEVSKVEKPSLRPGQNRGQASRARFSKCTFDSNHS